jgi:hypothetical protein
MFLTCLVRLPPERARDHLDVCLTASGGLMAFPFELFL